MALDSTKLLVAGQAFIYLAANGTTQPSDPTVDPTGTNEVQTVTVTGGPTGGTFTLSFGGQTTAAIAYNASASAVQAALEALSSIGAGNIAVTGNSGGPYAVTFQNGLGAKDVALLTASGTGLTGGTTPSVTVALTTNGTSTAWTNLGHTSYDDGIKFTKDVTKDVKKTHQAPAGARSAITNYAVKLALTAHQVDAGTLELFFGGTREADGTFWVPKSPQSFERAMYLRVIDGSTVRPFYIPRADITGSGDLLLKAGELASLPLEATVLDLAGTIGLAHIL